MNELVELIRYFTGINTWIALAGAALFVFLALFKATAKDLVVNMRVPTRKAAGVVHMFMILAAIVTLATLVLAFLDARDARADAASQAAVVRYQGQLDTRQTQVADCTSEAIADANFVQDFSTNEQGVRCPGGGCLGRSSSCNRREGWVSYTAPGDYFVESYDLIRGSMNDGNVADLEVYERDAEGRATAVRARMWCHPDSRPGAGGGWANASISGVVRLRKETQVRSEIFASCELQHPMPQAPS